MKITTENYFQTEIQSKFITNSQIKNFFGNAHIKGCSARAMALLNGEWKTEKTPSLLIGGYVDAYFEGSLKEFKCKNPEIYTQKGELRSEFKKAEEIIEVAKKDELFMNFMSGEKQVILQENIDGIEFLGKLDVLNKEHNLIVDLKVMKDMKDMWDSDLKDYVNFIRAWGIDEQLAIYRELVLKKTGKKYECYLAVLTKEKYPDKEVIYVPDEILNDALFSIKFKAGQVLEFKQGKKDAERCETCDYCKATKVLTKVKSYYEL